MDISQNHRLPAKSRWLGAPDSDSRQAVQLRAQVRTVRETNQQRTLSLLTQQGRERLASTRYRLHGLLAPLSLLGRGVADWTRLSDLVDPTSTGNGPTADFFRDFRYEILLPSRAAPLVDQPGIYQLYYTPVEATVDVLAGTLSRDAWGGTQFPFTSTGVIELGGRIIAGLPVPLPPTEAVIRLVATSGTQRLNWPAAWQASDAELTPVAGGFRSEEVAAADPAVRAWLVSTYKPADWTTISDAIFAITLVGQLIPICAAYDLPFTVAALQVNRVFLATQLGLANWYGTLAPLETGTAEVVGPRIRFDLAQGEISYLSWPVYSLDHPIRVVDSTENRAQLTSLGYQHQALHGQLIVPFQFHWSPFSTVPLRSFAPDVERVARIGAVGDPVWAGLDPLTDELVYRDLLDPGVIQLGRGVDYPHLNSAHYVYARVGHYLGPDLSGYNAFRAFYAVLPTARLLAPLVPFN